MDATQSLGTLNSTLSTNLPDPGLIEKTPNTQRWLNHYAPPLLRIHAGTDSSPSALPEVVQGEWNFSNLNRLVNNVRAYQGEPVMNVRYAPDWMWTCNEPFSNQRGYLKDPTFTDFGDYMARLVSYYNKGSMVTEDGTTISNPAGTHHRITYWEIWNEPDLNDELPCRPPHGVGLTSQQYVTMWNAVTPKMKAVDPTIKLVGPAVAVPTTGQDPDYIPALVADAEIKPDVISFHGYGGSANEETDRSIFDGDLEAPGEAGLAFILSQLPTIKSDAQGRPIWITEVNVNSAYDTQDPARRPWTAFGVAWGASAFRGLALGHVEVIHQYDYIEAGHQFSLVDPRTGDPLLPYWRDFLLSRSFPPDSAILSSDSSLREIEPLAVRKPNGIVEVLLINRQVNSETSVGGPGLPAHITLQIHGLAPKEVYLHQIDSDTNVAAGPSKVPLPASSSQHVVFKGYGLAVLDFLPSHP